MAKSDIAGAVEDCLSQLCREFYSAPTLFYTENDLVCRLHELLNERLPIRTSRDMNGHENSVIHTEYPTPFRCDMKGTSFTIVPDTDKGHRRGNYDIVVLNPKVFEYHTFEDLKCQHYDPNGMRLKSWSKENGPVIEYGIEFEYKRDEIGSWRSGDFHVTAHKRIAHTLQDFRKLHAALDIGFMKEAKAILFIRKCCPEALRHIKTGLAEYPTIQVQDSIQCRR